MARHRNVRSMKYEDECDYDDAYGHSVEDDYCVSPATAAQFTFDRTRSQQLFSFANQEEQIPEEDEVEEEVEHSNSLQDSGNYQRPKLSDTDEAKLNSCLEEMRNILGETVPEHSMVDAVLTSNFNYEVALNSILAAQEAPKPQRQPKERRDREASEIPLWAETSFSCKTNVLPLQPHIKPQVSDIKKPLEPTSTILLHLSNPMDQGNVFKDDQGTFNSHMPNDNQLKSCALKNLTPTRKHVDQVPRNPNASIYSEVSTNLVTPQEDGLTNDQQPCLSALDELHGSPLTYPSKRTVSEPGTFSLAALAKLHSSPSSLPSQRSASDKVPLPPETQCTLSSATQAKQHSKPPIANNENKNATSDLTALAHQQKLNSSSANTVSGGITLSSEAGSFSLAALAKQHKSSPMQSPTTKTASNKIKITSETSNFSLAALAKQHQSSPIQSPTTKNASNIQISSEAESFSLAALVKQHKSSPMNYPTTKTVSGNTASSPDASDLSLAALARQHKSSSRQPPTVMQHSGWISSTSDTGTVGLSALVKQHKSSQARLPTTLMSEKSTNKSLQAAETNSSLTIAAMEHPVPLNPHTHTLLLSQSVAMEKQTLSSNMVSSAAETASKPDTISNNLAQLARQHLSSPIRSASLPAQSRSSSIKNPTSITSTLTDAHTINGDLTSLANTCQVLTSQQMVSTNSYLNSSHHSPFYIALCTSNKVSISCIYGPKKRRHAAFSYLNQAIHGQNKTCDPVPSQIKAFDFSTPSPDDIVKEKQSGAFTRTGVRASGRSEVVRAAPNISADPAPIAVVSSVARADTTSDVARMTFPSGSKKDSGFKLEKDVSVSHTPDRSSVPSNKKDLNNSSVIDRFNDVMGKDAVDSEDTRGKEEAGLDGSSNNDSATPKKEQIQVILPPLHRSASKIKLERLDRRAEYEKRKAEGKDLINLVVIGHVDAGKSTLMGHVLFQLGFVNKRTMHKYEQESKKLGKASFAYAWVLDETEEERARGVTMDIAQTRFETASKVVTLLDAPGHKDFIPNMITGAAQADVAILVVNATRGEFETGFEAGGQTREHAMLIRSLGVSQLLVTINKMDTVEWSESRYQEITGKLRLFLKQTGFRDSDITFVPCSGLSGQNLTKAPSEEKLASWYSGISLVEGIDKFRPPERLIDRPFRLCVGDVFKGMGTGFSIAGTIQTGSLQVGDRVVVMPQGDMAMVKGVQIDEGPVQIAFAGDSAMVTIVGTDINNIGVGSILCDPLEPIKAACRFRARVVIFNIDVPITKGFPVVLHYQSLSEPAHVHRLVSQLHKSTGEVVKKSPRCLTKNSNAIIEFVLDRSICLELYKDFRDLGRITLRYLGATIAAGLVTDILDKKANKTES